MSARGDQRQAAGRAGGPQPAAKRAPATITPYRDGPLLVRGDFQLTTPDGAEIDPGRATVALCRCGASGIKPFCDGSHALVGFRAAVTEDLPGRADVPDPAGVVPGQDDADGRR